MPSEYIQKAYEITDRINVSGGAIEQMYQLRQFLRQAYQEARKLEDASAETDEPVVNAN